LASLVLLTVVGVTLRLMLSNALQPLHDVAGSIRAIAGGDIFAPLQTYQRQDEVGAISHAVEVFKSHALSLAQRDFSDKLEQISSKHLLRRRFHICLATLVLDRQVLRWVARPL
jgi:methyl-accepting chemotaxis protein